MNLPPATPNLPVRSARPAGKPSRAAGLRTIAIGVLGATALLMWAVFGRAGVGGFGSWRGFHLMGGGAGVPQGTLELGDVTTDIRDSAGNAYTLDVSMTVELRDEVQEDARKRLVASGRHAAIQALRGLGYESFGRDEFDDARERVVSRVRGALGDDRVETVLFTDLTFYPQESKPPITAIHPLSPSAPKRTRPPIPPLAPFVTPPPKRTLL